jgi:peroxiredoxin
VKKILPIAVLVVLIVWGAYDAMHKGNINNASRGNTNNIETKTADNGNIKEGIKNNNLAPDFELTTLDGKNVKLSDYRGKKVILNFWATWCPPCKAEIPDLEKFYSDFKDKDTVILGVDLMQSEKSQQSVSMFVGTYKITYPILLDKEGTANQKYQISAIPTSYIIDSKGVIRNKVVGPMDYETMKSMLESIN